MTEPIPSDAPLQVLYEDNHCLAVVKPSRVPTAGDDSGDPTLLDRAKEYVRIKYAKPGRVYLGLVHRLDRPVSGVVLFARTGKAASRLSRQFRDGLVEKTYWACVEGILTDRDGEWIDWLAKDPERNRVRTVPEGHPDGKRAVTGFRSLHRKGTGTLVELYPKTGRSHQLRVQLAMRGLPIVGDVKYGASRSRGGSIALHALSLSFEHPTIRERVTVTTPPPSPWPISSP